MSERIAKLNSLVQQEVSAILLREVDRSAEYLVTVTRVAVADDAENATVWLSVLPTDARDKALKDITADIMDIQSMLNKRLVMKFVPKLHFRLDRAEEKAGHITHALDRLTDEDLGLTPPKQPPA